MDQNRTRTHDDPTRSSNMEKAEGSRETIRNNQEDDLGTSSDRAMFDERMSSAGESPERDSGMSGERISGSDMQGEGGRGQRSGGISNRDLDREQSEQDQLPERGRSQSEE